MDFIRKDGRIDIDAEIENGNIVEDEEEQRGARLNKFWFNNYRYMYKDVYQFTYEDYAEMIASKLANKLNIKCAKYDLAIHNGNIGVITESLIEDNTNEELISGQEIMNRVYTEYIQPVNDTMIEYEKLKEKYNARNINEFSNLSKEQQLELRKKLLYLVNDINDKNFDIIKDKFNSNCIDFAEIDKIYEYLESYNNIYNSDFLEMKGGIVKANNLYDIWNVLEIYSSINNYNIDIETEMNNLINMFIFDIITSQSDRHAENWSIILNNKDKTIRLCPLYDNSGICSLNREKAIKNIVSYDNDLQDKNIRENKKKNIKRLLESTINHSNSGLKVDLSDVEEKNKNKKMLQKFIINSDEIFNKKLQTFANSIDEMTLDEIYEEIEKQTGIKVPDDVKKIVKVVIFNNIKMINETYTEGGKVR